MSVRPEPYALRMEQESERSPTFNFPRLGLSQPIPPWPHRWGRWALDAEHLVLRHEENYEIRPERFSSAAPMLDMIVQVRNKGFMTTTDVGDFVAALDDIFHVQGSLVPSGVDRRIEDVPAFLRRRITENARPD
jgi:hypothetical protein